MVGCDEVEHEVAVLLGKLHEIGVLVDVCQRPKLVTVSVE
jgi:hypothetical protein